MSKPEFNPDFNQDWHQPPAPLHIPSSPNPEEWTSEEKDDFIRVLQSDLEDVEAVRCDSFEKGWFAGYIVGMSDRNQG